jgi:acetyl esterase/lipase
MIGGVAGTVEIAAMNQVLILAYMSVGFYAASAVKAADGPQVLDVWPGKSVGDHGQIGSERVRAPSEAPTQDATWITNVTRPTISVFHAGATNKAEVAIVICPGGGYWNLAWDKEGEEVAAWLNTLGITGVVLKYRVPRRPGEPEREPAPGALFDAQRAISLVRSRAKEWGIDPERIGVMGFSAGGHLAVMTAISFEKRSYAPIDESDRSSCRPNFAIAAYPGYILTQPGSGVLAEYIRIPKGTGPVFLVHASDDDERGAQPEQSLALYGALRHAGVPVEMHIYDTGGHGFGVRKDRGPVSNWPARCAEWLKHRGILPGGIRRSESARGDRPPRKVIVGTTIEGGHRRIPASLGWGPRSYRRQPRRIPGAGRGGADGEGIRDIHFRDPESMSAGGVPRCLRDAQAVRSWVSGYPST